MAAPLSKGSSMSDVLVKRWKRYGHDRVYVETADGHRLGHWDNKTGTASLDDASEADLFYRALREQLNIVPAAGGVGTVVRAKDDARPMYATDPAPTCGAAVSQPPPAISAAVERDATAAQAEPSWRDLAPTRAGAGARAQGMQARQAAPVRMLRARVLGVHTDERAWRLGADGEEVVGARLSKLDSRWRVIHSVAVRPGQQRHRPRCHGARRRLHPQHEESPRRPGDGRRQCRTSKRPPDGLFAEQQVRGSTRIEAPHRRRPGSRSPRLASSSCTAPGVD